MVLYQIKDGCPGCGACSGVCPVDAIVPAHGLGMSIGPACIDCGICISLCPVGLIAPGAATTSDKGGLQEDE